MLYFERKKKIICVCVCICICTFRYKASEKIYEKYCLPVGFQFYSFVIFEPGVYISVQKSIISIKNQNQFTKNHLIYQQLHILHAYCVLKHSTCTATLFPTTPVRALCSSKSKSSETGSGFPRAAQLAQGLTGKPMSPSCHPRGGPCLALTGTVP